MIQGVDHRCTPYPWGSALASRAMCGRATLVTPIDEIAEELGVAPIPIGPPRYNVAPGQPVLVLAEGGLAMLDWGLRPFWSKKPMIQARAETVATKFGDAF